MAYLHLFQVVPLYSYKLVQHEHTPGCELLGRQRVANGSSSGESVARTEQSDSGSSWAGVRRACDAGRHAPGHLSGLGRSAAALPTSFCKALDAWRVCLHYIGLKKTQK